MSIHTANRYHMKLQLYRERVLVFLTHKIGMPYFRMVRKPLDFRYSLAVLESLPPDTVGRGLFDFLQQHHLELLPYYEKHDIKHIILDYPPTEKGEVCLQCFMLANGRYTLPVLLTVLFGFCTMPEYWRDFGKALQRGYRNKSLQQVKWFDLLPFNMQLVRELLLQPSEI